MITVNALQEKNKHILARARTCNAHRVSKRLRNSKSSSSSSSSKSRSSSLP